MPRSSRHRSHRSHKHLRDHSDSEEDGITRDRKGREEEPGASSHARVSRDPETGNRRSSHERAGKDLVGSSNGDVSGEYVKKRKERVDEEGDDERWNGGAENDLKRTKSEDFSPVEFDNNSKTKLLAADFKERSGRRYEDSNVRDEDAGGKNDFAKLKSGKGSGGRESNNQYDDGMVSDKMERDSSKDREWQESRHDKCDDWKSRKHDSKSGSSAQVISSRKHTKITENKAQDVFNSPKAEKGFEKHDRKRDDCEDKDKWLDDGRDLDDRKQSSRDGISKSRIYKDEKHEDSKHTGKYRNETDKVQKYNDDKYQEKLSKDRTSDISEKWHLRDESKPFESHYRKSKHQVSDQNGTYADDIDVKFKDSRGRKRYADEMEDHNDLKPRSAREWREVAEKYTSSTSRTGPHSDKPRSEYHHSEKTDSSPRSNRLKSSISSSAYSAKDHNRETSKLTESGHRELAAEDRQSFMPTLKGDSLTSAVNDRVTSNRSGKQTTKGDSGELFVETTAASKYDRTFRSDARASPNHSKRSPSTNSGWCISERSPKYDRTARQRLDIETGQRNSLTKDGDRRESWGQPIIDDVSQNDVYVRELTSVRPSSTNRGGNLSDYSRNHLLPLTPMRLGSPSVLGPYQDDNKAQSCEHKSYSHHKRIGDLGFGRGHGNAWKNSPTSWPSPVPNGFASIQHGPPAGFHPAMSQFSAPPFFGVRPPMIHGGVSYHMHDEADRFSSHERPFGWHNPVDHSHLQIWDGSNGIYSNEPHIYGRPEWDEGKQIGSRVWEMGSETWKGQNSNSTDIPVSKKERESSSNSLFDELAQSKSLLTESSEARKSSTALPAKISIESSAEIVTKTAEPSSKSGDELRKHVFNYFTRLEISPDLLDPELLQRCTSLSETFDARCSMITHQCFQTNKDGRLVKMKSSSSMMKSFFPTAKDAILKRALSQYRKHKEGLNGKHAASLLACTEKNKISSSEDADNEINRNSSSEDADNINVVGDSDLTLRLKSSHFDDNSTCNIEDGNDAAPMESDCPANANDDKESVFMPDSVISTAKPCEALMEECSETVTRIPAH